MNGASGKLGGVVILGVKGSGKTVFLSVLGKTFEEAQAFGLNMTGMAHTDTVKYVGEVFDRMSRQNEWPVSTIEGTRRELAWTVRCGDEDLFAMQSIDCAGEEIVKALVSTGNGKAGSRNKKDQTQEDSGAEWDSDENGDDSDTVSLIARRVEEASTICIVVNPADFEKYIYGKGDNFGPEREITNALNRSHDMWYLLQTFLEKPRSDGKKIIVAVAQAGREDFAGLLGEKGSARALLLDLNRQFANWRGFKDAHVIAVSAVNHVVYKRKVKENGRWRNRLVLDSPSEDIAGKSVDELLEGGFVLFEKKLDPDDPYDKEENEEINRLERRIVELKEKNLDTDKVEIELMRRKCVWIGKDGTEHAKARECPRIGAIYEADSSIGLVEFLLAVGSPLCADLRPLDDGLRQIRKCQFALFEAKKYESPEKERLQAADNLRKAWEAYRGFAVDFLGRHNQNIASEATYRHLADEEANVIGVVSAEEEIDLLLRHAASIGKAPTFEESVSQIVAGTAERVARAISNSPDVVERYRRIERNDIFVKPLWLDVQFNNYSGRLKNAIREFDAAISCHDAQAASKAFGDIECWGIAADAENRRGEFEACKDFVSARSARMNVIGKVDGLRGKLDFGDASGCLESGDFAEARKKAGQVRNAACEIEKLLHPLESEGKKFGDSDKIDNLLRAAQEAIAKFEALNCEIDDREMADKIQHLLAPVDEAIGNAGKALADAKSQYASRAFVVARGMAVKSSGNYADAEARLGKLVVAESDDAEFPGGIRLFPSDERVIARRKAIVEGRQASGELLGNIERRIQRIVKRRLIIYSTAVAIAVSLGLWFWLKGRADLNSKLRSSWKVALMEAGDGKYRGAADIINTIQDKKEFLVYRSSIVDEDLAWRIKNGTEFHNLKDKMDKGIGELQKSESDFLSTNGLGAADSPSIATNEWLAYSQAKTAAMSLIPKLDLDKFNLPGSRREMVTLKERFKTTAEAIAEAAVKLKAFQESATLAIEEEKRAARIAELGKTLNASTPPQGWKTLAEALPPEGVDAWLDLPDEKLSAKFKAFLSTGLPKGERVDSIDFSSATNAFTELRAKSTEEEWNSHFAEIENDCKAVLEAGAMVRDEQKRRSKIAAIGKLFENEEYKKAASEIDAMSGAQGESARRLEGCRATLDKVILKGVADAVANGNIDFKDFGTGARFDFTSQYFSKTVDEALAAEIDKICPDPNSGTSDYSPDMALIRNFLEGLGGIDSFYTMARHLHGRLDGWRAKWLAVAGEFAYSANHGSLSPRDKWDAVTKAESLLSWIDDFNLIVAPLKHDGQETPDYNAKFPWAIRDDAMNQSPDDIREKLPPVMRVTLLSRDGKKALDAYSLVTIPAKAKCGSLPNSSTGASDLLVTDITPGVSLKFKFKGDNDNDVRVVNCGWRGSMNFVMRLNTKEYTNEINQ